MKRIILASGSAARKALLKQIGIDAVVIKSNIDERCVVTDEPESLVCRLAELKAETVAKKFDDGIVLGFDTVVSFEDKIIGKPASLEEARKIISEFSGKSHRIHTGICIIDIARNKKLVGNETTEVFFRKLTETEIDRYIRRDRVLEKAGAYSVLESGGLLIERIEGCFFNIVGIPLAKLSVMMHRLGYSLIEDFG